MQSHGSCGCGLWVQGPRNRHQRLEWSLDCFLVSPGPLSLGMTAPSVQCSTESAPALRLLSLIGDNTGPWRCPHVGPALPWGSQHPQFPRVHPKSRCHTSQPLPSRTLGVIPRGISSLVPLTPGGDGPCPPPPAPDLCAQPPRPRLCLHCCRELTQLLSTLAPFWLPSTSSWPGLQSTDSAATLPRPPPQTLGRVLAIPDSFRRTTSPSPHLKSQSLAVRVLWSH